MNHALANVCLVSGGDKVRLRSPLNHKVYADLAGFDYRLEVGPFAGLKNKFYFKLAAMRAVLPRYEWAIWLDDDAFVTDFARDTFHEQIKTAESNGKFFVIADSPVNADGWWTRVNGGVFLVKNCPQALALIDQAMSITPSEILDWWRPEEHGSFCGGDQDVVLWAGQTTFPDGFDIVPHAVFNSRWYEYGGSASDNFVCHFAGVPDKVVAISEFARRFGLDDTLMSADLRSEYGVPTGEILTPVQMRLVVAKHRALRKIPSLRRGTAN